MSARLRIIAAGPYSSLQDGGRQGHLRFGVSASGPMDRVSMAIANALVGNPPDTAAIEMTLAGMAFEVMDAPVRVAIAGADMAVAVNGEAQGALRSLLLQPGDEMRIGPARTGARAYLAVEGGFPAAPVLGSVSAHSRSRIGGWNAGERLADGAVIAAPAAGNARALMLPPDVAPPAHSRIRAVLGPQDDYFTAQAIETLGSATYTVTAQADRMGYRLAGPKLAHARGFNTVSDAIMPGSIQVPGTAEPIVLMADRQTTGGYPKIATVIGADLAVLGQKRPGDEIRFEIVEMDAAHKARAALAAWLAALPGRLVPATDPMDAGRLLSLNLIGGVIDGRD